jgi:hypothetical protein
MWRVSALVVAYSRSSAGESFAEGAEAIADLSCRTEGQRGRYFAQSVEHREMAAVGRLSVAMVSCFKLTSAPDRFGDV